MGINLDAARSRRAVIVAALGAGLASVASALGRAAPVDAANGDVVKVGAYHAGTIPTRISNDAGTALIGLSTTGVGFYARSQTLLGDSPFQGKIGVRAQAFHDSTSIGVLAETTSGQAVRGVAMTTGTGGYFTSDTGTALEVAGKVKFQRSGKASVAANKSSVDVTVPGGLTSSAVVLATIQMNRTGVYIRGVRPNYPTTGKARIYLNKVASTSTTTPVGWLVVG
jgi:hypothetical protein